MYNIETLLKKYSLKKKKRKKKETKNNVNKDTSIVDEYRVRNHLQNSYFNDN